MLTTTRASARLHDSHSAAPSFQLSQSPSFPSSSQVIHPQTRPPFTNSSWSSAPPPSMLAEVQPFGNQDPSSLATIAGVASKSAIRAGFGPRSNNEMIQNSMQPTLFAKNGATQTGGMMRKKRRRYGPKPEPPYTCFCGKVYQRHEHMLRHRATHDDDIKYECPICGKCFRRQDVMHRHTMTHTNRSRTQQKMRTTASSSAHQSNGNSRGGEEERMARAGRKREQGHVQFGGQGGAGGDMLEDPLLRVGLASHASTPSSTRHLEDHHIAAAQLYNACNGVRFSYPQYSVAMQPGHGADMAGTNYARLGEYGVMPGYHSRMTSSMSPPPSFFPPQAGFAPESFGTHMSLSALPGAEYEPKTNGYDAGHYGQNWPAGGYGFAHSSINVGASESEWSEHSPFASPAWSQKAELMVREGGGTPSGMSNRQLSMDPAARWHHQQHQQYQQHGSPLLNGGGVGGVSLHHHSPAQEPRRRLSTAYSGPHHVSHPHTPKSESNGAGAGLGIFDQPPHGHNESGSLGFFPTPTLANPSAPSDRLPVLHPSSPHISNGAPLFPSPAYYLGSGGMSSMQPPHTALLSASEAFDTGSPLTEVTGNTSPRTHAQRAESVEVDGKEEEGAGSSIDPHLKNGRNMSRSSTAGVSVSSGGQNGSKRLEERYRA